MSESDSKQKLKVLQVVQNFFTKALQIIVQTRSLLEPQSPDAKINKWFNLYMASLDDEHVRHELRPWKLHPDLMLFPPMIIETCLDLSQLNAHEHVVLLEDGKSVWPVLEGLQKEIVVERWLIKFDANNSGSGGSAVNSSIGSSPSDELPLMYKHAIVLLRTIYTLVRLLPLYKLRKILSKHTSRNLVLVNHFLDGSQPVTSKNRIGLSKSIIPQHLLGESHLTQRDFTPIVSSVGSLSVSVVYRNHYNFQAQDQEERLSSQFASSDKEDFHHFGDPFPKGSSVLSTLGNRVVKTPAVARDKTAPFRGSFEQFRERFLVLPCTSEHLERVQMSPPRAGLNMAKYGGQNRAAIQPFRVGSITGSTSSSPPPQGGHHTTPSGHSPAPTSTNMAHANSMAERRVLITSNRSGSNASLIALLRNPRAGTSALSTTTAAMAVSGPLTHTASLPRSIASSHGSHLPHDDAGGETSGTPKFLSSFGSRQSRRFSSTSSRFAAGQQNDSTTSYMGTSLDLGSSCAPSSGIYIDDDISSFVRMIDGKSELRLSTSTNVSESRASPSSHDPTSPADALNRFHLLKSQYQQLGDSVNASLVLQKHHSDRDTQSIDSRLTSSKLAHSGNSAGLPAPLAVLPLSSFDNKILPSISSRLSNVNLEENNAFSSKEGSYCRKRTPSSGTASGAAGSMKNDISGPVTTRAMLNRTKTDLQYPDVFEDDDDGQFYGRSRGRPLDGQEDYDNDDLLFEMTDTR